MLFIPSSHDEQHSGRREEQTTELMPCSDCNKSSVNLEVKLLFHCFSIVIQGRGCCNKNVWAYNPDLRVNKTMNLFHCTKNEVFHYGFLQ